MESNKGREEQQKVDIGDLMLLAECACEFLRRSSEGRRRQKAHAHLRSSQGRGWQEAHAHLRGTTPLLIGDKEITKTDICRRQCRLLLSMPTVYNILNLDKLVMTDEEKKLFKSPGLGTPVTVIDPKGSAWGFTLKCWKSQDRSKRSYVIHGGKYPDFVVSNGWKEGVCIKLYAFRERLSSNTSLAILLLPDSEHIYEEGEKSNGGKPDHKLFQDQPGRNAKR